MAKPVVFKDLDTVKKQPHGAIDHLLKIKAILNPTFAFSDTQLLDNAGFRDLYRAHQLGRSNNMACIFDTPMPQKCVHILLQEAAFIKDKNNETRVSFKNLIRNMLNRKDKKGDPAPMIFSSLSESAKAYVKGYIVANTVIDYPKFIELLSQTEGEESAAHFDDYIGWLEESINARSACTYAAAEYKPYGTLVDNVLKRLPDVPELKVINPNLVGELRDLASVDRVSRSAFYRYLEAQHPADKALFTTIADHSYNFNLAAANKGSLHMDLPSHSFRVLYYYAGQMGDRETDLTRKYVHVAEETLKKNFWHEALDLERLTFDDVTRVRSEAPFDDFRANFLDGGDVSGLKKYVDYLLSGDLNLPRRPATWEIKWRPVSEAVGEHMIEHAQYAILESWIAAGLLITFGCILKKDYIGKVGKRLLDTDIRLQLRVEN